jgi:purine-binding chemotaxis protein CheW
VIELLTFSLGGEEYAFRVSDLQEIVRHQQISRVPRSAAFLLGISSLRGKIIPVIDLRELLLLRGEPADARRRKVLILKGPKGPLGAVVDRVVGVKRTRASAVSEAPAHLREAELRFIEGVVLIDNKFVSILKTDEALHGDFFGERREGGGE